MVRYNILPADTYIVINKSILKGYKPNIILVPCYTVKDSNLLSCFKIKEIKIENKLIKKECLVGISDNNFDIDGVELLLHKNIIKEI